MLKKTLFFYTGLLIMNVLGNIPVYAARHSILLKTNNISIHSSSDTTLGNVYTMKFNIPEELHQKQMLGAFLEFYVDVSSLERNGYINDTPVIEIYALQNPFWETVDSTQLALPSHMVRNVLQGNDRKLKWDITNIVRGFIDEPSMNHGLIIGSLSGSRDGVFLLKNNILPENAFAKIILFYNDVLSPLTSKTGKD